MSKAKLFKRIAASAITAAMCLSFTLSANADTSSDLKAGFAGASVTNEKLAESYSSYLSDLQPYVDELQNINDEFGYGIALCTSTEDDVAWLHSEFCSMTIPEFRDYVIDLYNSKYANYAVPDLDHCVAMSVPASHEQKSLTSTLANNPATFSAMQYVYTTEGETENYFWVKSSQYNYITGGKTVKMYKSVDSSGYHTPVYPTWNPYSYTWKEGTSARQVICTFNVRWFLAPAMYVKGSSKAFKVTMTAGTKSYLAYLPDWEY